MNLKRYRLCPIDEDMVLDDAGDYVLFDDVMAMSAESKSFLCRCLACGWVGVGEECQHCVRQGRTKDVLEVKETDAKKNTDYYKARRFEVIQTELWAMAERGNLLQSTVASALIRELFIEGPDGQEPEEA